jgi:hypothetical protein
MSTARIRSTISSSTTRTFVEALVGIDDMGGLTLSSEEPRRSVRANCSVAPDHAHRYGNDSMASAFTAHFPSSAASALRFTSDDQITLRFSSGNSEINKDEWVGLFF